MSTRETNCVRKVSLYLFIYTVRRINIIRKYRKEGIRKYTRILCIMYLNTIHVNFSRTPYLWEQFRHSKILDT